MQKQRGAIEIVLVFLLVVALGLGGYFYLRSGKTPLTPLEWFVADEENLKVRTPSTPTPDPTAEWKTYESAKPSTLSFFAFSIKYPDLWRKEVEITEPP